MKNRYLAAFGILGLGCFGLTSFAHAAAGGISSGGSPRPPTAVVIQERFQGNEKPSLDIEMTVRSKVGSDLKEGKVQAFFQADDGIFNEVGRMRWCIEYSNFEEFTEAKQKFHEIFVHTSAVEVVENGDCSTRN